MGAFGFSKSGFLFGWVKFWLFSCVSQALSDHPYDQSQTQVEISSWCFFWSQASVGSVPAHVLLLLISQTQHLLASLFHRTPPRPRTMMQAMSFFSARDPTLLLVTGSHGRHEGPAGAPSPLLQIRP
ncbi:hypothetical protein SORBI_3010G105250 [Sorghum bicolor]|uniref:Secreted protein n=1 Tax=Sorghum bicolor TaxID=4558 RepID=A0A1W0VSD0_SORBI|nr:hypothetical protein SORBI_3010G105250 [Sorghum bicolor]